MFGIFQLIKTLLPYKKLYENCADYKKKYQIWIEAIIGTFEPDEIENDVETFYCNIVELGKQFSSVPAPYTLTNSVCFFLLIKQQLFINYQTFLYSINF